MYVWGISWAGGGSWWRRSTHGPRVCTTTGTSTTRSFGSSFSKLSSPLAIPASKTPPPTSTSVPFASWLTAFTQPFTITYFYFYFFCSFLATFFFFNVNLFSQYYPSLNRSRCCAKGICTGNLLVNAWLAVSLAIVVGCLLCLAN